MVSNKPQLKDQIYSSLKNKGLRISLNLVERIELLFEELDSSLATQPGLFQQINLTGNYPEYLEYIKESFRIYSKSMDSNLFMYLRDILNDLSVNDEDVVLRQLEVSLLGLLLYSGIIKDVEVPSSGVYRLGKSVWAKKIKSAEEASKNAVTLREMRLFQRFFNHSKGSNIPHVGSNLDIQNNSYSAANVSSLFKIYFNQHMGSLAEKIKKLQLRMPLASYTDIIQTFNVKPLEKVQARYFFTGSTDEVVPLSEILVHHQALPRPDRMTQEDWDKLKSDYFHALDIIAIARMTMESAVLLTNRIPPDNVYWFEKIFCNGFERLEILNGKEQTNGPYGKTRQFAKCVLFGKEGVVTHAVQNTLSCTVDVHPANSAQFVFNNKIGIEALLELSNISDFMHSPHWVIKASQAIKAYLKNPRLNEEKMVEAVSWMQYSLDLDKTHQFLSSIHLEGAIFRDHHLRNLGLTKVESRNEVEFARFKAENLVLHIISRVYNYLFREIKDMPNGRYFEYQEKAVTLGGSLFEMLYYTSTIYFDNHIIKAGTPGYISRLRKAEIGYYKQVIALLENSELFACENQEWFKQLFSLSSLEKVPGLQKKDTKNGICYFISPKEYVDNWDATNIAFVWDTITANYFSRHKSKEIDYNPDSWYLSCMIKDTELAVIRLLEKALVQLEDYEHTHTYRETGEICRTLFCMYDLSSQWGLNFEGSYPYWNGVTMDQEINRLKSEYPNFIDSKPTLLSKYYLLDEILRPLRENHEMENLGLRSTLEQVGSLMFYYRAFSDFSGFLTLK